MDWSNAYLQEQFEQFVKGTLNERRNAHTMSDETTSGEETQPSQGKTLAQIGAETIGNVLRNALAEAGVSEAVGFSIVLKNGATHEVLSDSNPVLNEPATEMSSFKIKQSAEGG